jgi:SAM-dependent methyltransferase
MIRYGLAVINDETEAFWENHYQARDQIWSGRPNPVLVETVAALRPGSALDLGCGEGGDALWLATQGWLVTATDISTTALARAQAAADSAGVADKIVWQRHDFAESFPVGEFDLVSAQFLQTPLEFPRREVLAAAARAVAPGGLLLIVSHATAPPWSPQNHGDHQGHGHGHGHGQGHGHGLGDGHGHGNPDGHGHDHGQAMFPTIEETLADLDLPADQWRIDRAELAEREATGPDGTTGTLLDSVIAATRIAAGVNVLPRVD